MSEIINRVASSGLITLDLDDFYPEGQRFTIDLAEQLWQGLALKETEFREWISKNDWSVYSDGHVALFCSADAIIPQWAFMLVTSKLSGIAKTVHFGDAAGLETKLWSESLGSIDAANYQDARLIIKGCANREVSPSAFMDLVFKLQPVAKSIMYGEPCSTVPVWKRPKK